MARDDYAPIGGALKIKGGAGVTKSKLKKKRKQKPSTSTLTSETQSNSSIKEDASTDTNNQDKKDESQDGSPVPGEDVGGLNDTSNVVGKTEAERKFEEMKRKRLDQKLLKEGAKTHKERVEEFNKYLANLSEHHDMPRIGPG